MATKPLRPTRGITLQLSLEGTASDVDSAKPEPDVFTAALEAVGGEPSQAVVVGDTGWDVQAARAAGIRAMTVRSGGWTTDQLRREGAVSVHDDVAHLLADLTGEPDATEMGKLLGTISRTDGQPVDRSVHLYDERPPR
ncbi:MAG: HAD-IA family hydrolase [Actinomycetota bacterium]|nr:HAD-IA family hydrolase [Actinomycetota bacterium]